MANGEDDERLTESRKVQFRHIIMDLLRPEVNVSLAGLPFLPIPEQIMLRQHWFAKNTTPRRKDASGAHLNPQMCNWLLLRTLVPLVGAVVALTLTTIVYPRSGTLETSISLQLVTLRHWSSHQ